MRQHHPFRAAGRPRSVGEERQVIGIAPVDFPFDIPGMRGAELAAGRLDLGKGFEPAAGIVPQPLRIVVDDEFEMRQLRPQGQDLVDLLLVFGDDDRNLGVVQHKDQLAGDRVLVHRHRGAAEALGRQLRPIEAGPIVANDRELVAAAKAVRGQAQRKIAHLLPILRPGEGLPDAVVLFADRRPPRHLFGVAPQQTRQGRLRHAAAASRRSFAVPR